jgi:hypothetical protein
LRDDYRRQVHELIAPSHFPGEIASALTKAERQKLIAVGEALLLLPRGVSALGGDVVDLAAAMQVGQQSLADQTLTTSRQRRLADGAHGSYTGGEDVPYPPWRWTGRR